MRSICKLEVCASTVRDSLMASVYECGLAFPYDGLVVAWYVKLCAELVKQALHLSALFWALEAGKLCGDQEFGLL